MRDPPGKTIEALHRTATSLQSQGTIEGVCELTVSAAAEVLEFNLCTILIREGEWLVPYATSKDAPADGSRRMRLDQGLAGKTYRTGSSQIVEKIEPDDETDPAKTAYRSGISVPIGEHGAFQAVSTTEAAFDQGDIELAELLVSHTKTALDRIEREQELKQQVERLDQFASVVSHDLQNPLSIAQGYLELAREEEDSEPLRKAAAAHERMHHLIDDMLTFARVGTEAITPETVELARLTEECWTSLEQENASLHIDTEQRIRADRKRLRQLIENLLSNAVHYGGTDVSITVGELDCGFYVEDDGPGIPADERTAVFEAGYSLGTDGTGFGLSIARQIAEAHVWEICVIEGRDDGARFEITGVKVSDE